MELPDNYIEIKAELFRVPRASDNSELLFREDLWTYL